MLGDEDHLGDMDFKVAGTEAGITSLQKWTMQRSQAITPEDHGESSGIKPRLGRVHILGEMKQLSLGGGEFSVSRTTHETSQIPTDKIP